MRFVSEEAWLNSVVQPLWAFLSTVAFSAARKYFALCFAG